MKGEINIKVEFKNTKLNIKNDKDSKSEFEAVWNGYTIEIYPYKQKINNKTVTKYEANCVNTLGSWIVNGGVYENKSAALQDIFDNISSDIEDLESEKQELEEILNKFTLYKKEIICPKCKSKRIFKFRMDSDWASGSGDYSYVNEENNYTEEELEYDSFDRPDVEVFRCLDCGKLF